MARSRSSRCKEMGKFVCSGSSMVMEVRRLEVHLAVIGRVRGEWGTRYGVSAMPGFYPSRRLFSDG